MNTTLAHPQPDTITDQVFHRPNDIELCDLTFFLHSIDGEKLGVLIEHHRQQADRVERERKRQALFGDSWIAQYHYGLVALLRAESRRRDAVAQAVRP